MNGRRFLTNKLIKSITYLNDNVFGLFLFVLNHNINGLLQWTHKQVEF